MATFKAVKNRTQSAGAMRRVLDYAEQEKKTAWEECRLVTGWNCVARSALEEMTTTKQRFQKTEGRQFYQFVQSFSPEERVSPEEVHAIGLELAERLFPEFEVFVVTHTDTGHLHSHLIVNSVSFVDGHKLHQNAADLQRQRQISDEICAAHGLTVLEPAQRYGHGKGMKSGEYRSAARGESWKLQLMNTIDLCMGRARSRKQFVQEMERRGYQVRWEDGRKHITYTTPEGKKCRDVRLHDRKYLKEVMEREFRIRETLVHGRAEAYEPGEIRRAGVTRSAVNPADPACADPVRGAGVDGPAGAENIRAGAADGYADQAAAGDARRDIRQSADGKADAGSENAANPDRTGWETEREEALRREGLGSAPAYRPGGVPVYPSELGSAAGSVVQLGRALEMNGNGAPARDATTIPQRHGESKQLAREREKKIAMGHKPGDREEQQQTMN